MEGGARARTNLFVQKSESRHGSNEGYVTSSKKEGKTMPRTSGQETPIGGLKITTFQSRN